MCGIWQCRHAMNVKIQCMHENTINSATGKYRESIEKSPSRNYLKFGLNVWAKWQWTLLFVCDVLMCIIHIRMISIVTSDMNMPMVILSFSTLYHFIASISLYIKISFLYFCGRCIQTIIIDVMVDDIDNQHTHTHTHTFKKIMNTIVGQKLWGMWW